MLPPTALHIGGLGLILGVLTFAQRLGAWENKHFARVAVLVAYAFGVAWLFFFVQERAAWICTVVLAVLFTWPIKGWLREYTVSRRGGAISKEVTKTPDSDVRSLEVRTNAPRVRVDYVDDGRAGGKGALVFKSDKPAIIQNVGDLISRERYESQHEFNLIPSPPSPIDVNSSIEYRMYGLRRRNSPDIRSLVDILRGGPNGNECVDSVVIDYDDDNGNEFSRRFDLKRNQDNSVAWIPASEISLRGQATFPEPGSRNLADLRQDLYLASKSNDEHSAAVRFSRQLEEERTEVRKLTEELNRVRVSGPQIKIAPSSPQGGMVLFDPTLTSPPLLADWIHFSLSVTNTDPSLSACDLTVGLDFEEEGAKTNPRRVERAVFRTSDMTFPNKLCCLEAGHSAECVMAVWSNSLGVQTIRSWTNGAPSLPLGDELYPGVWWCNVIAKAQGVEQRGRYRFKVLKNSVSRFMLPPGTPGETG